MGRLRAHGPDRAPGAALLPGGTIMSEITSNLSLSLAEVLRYRHPGVVRRYCKEHQATQEEGEEIFRETLKWLYLCHRATSDGPEGFACAMHPEIEKIDWMWHTFVLFTRDYADFCASHFGCFLHHVPNEAEDEDADAAGLDEAALREHLEKQYGLVYDVLGEETLSAWYDECRYAAPT
jgi:hypothetical protein